MADLVKPNLSVAFLVWMHLREEHPENNSLMPDSNDLTKKIEKEFATNRYDPEVLSALLRNSLHPANNARRLKSEQIISNSTILEYGMHLFQAKLDSIYNVEVSRQPIAAKLSDDEKKKHFLCHFKTVESIVRKEHKMVVSLMNKRRLPKEDTNLQFLEGFVNVPKYIFLISAMEEFFRISSPILLEVFTSDPEKFNFENMISLLNNFLLMGLYEQVTAFLDTTSIDFTPVALKLIKIRDVDYFGQFLSEIERYVVLYYHMEIMGRMPLTFYNLEYFLKSGEQGLSIWNSVTLIFNSMAQNAKKINNFNVPPKLRSYAKIRRTFTIFLAKFLSQVSFERDDVTEEERKVATIAVMEKFFHHLGLKLCGKTALSCVISCFTGSLPLSLGSLAYINGLGDPKWLVTFPSRLPVPTRNFVPNEVNMKFETKGAMTRPSWGLIAPINTKKFNMENLYFPSLILKPKSNYRQISLFREEDDFKYHAKKFRPVDCDEFFAELSEIFSYTDRYLYMLFYLDFKKILSQFKFPHWRNVGEKDQDEVMKFIIFNICFNYRYIDRIGALYALLYLLQGVWLENRDLQAKKDMIEKNVFLFIKCNGLEALIERLGISNTNPGEVVVTIREQKFILTALYIVVEVLRKEQSSTDPIKRQIVNKSSILFLIHQEKSSKNSLITILFNLLDVHHRYDTQIPVKRIVLMLHKLFLLIIGGFESYKCAKKILVQSYKIDSTQDYIDLLFNKWSIDESSYERDYFLLKKSNVTKKKQLDRVFQEFRDGITNGPSKIVSSTIERFYYALMVENYRNLPNLLLLLNSLECETPENHKVFNEVFHVTDIPFRLDKPEIKLMLETECARHKEIIYKSVSGFLILCAKHFKLNSYPQFEHFAQKFMMNDGIQKYLKCFRMEKHQYASLIVPNFEFPESVTEPADIPHFNQASPIKTKSVFSWRKCFTKICMLKLITEVVQRNPGRIVWITAINSAPSLYKLMKIPNKYVKRSAHKVAQLQRRYLKSFWAFNNIEFLSSFLKNIDLLDEDLLEDATLLRPWHFREHELIISHFIENYLKRNYPFNNNQ